MSRDDSPALSFSSTSFAYPNRATAAVDSIDLACSAGDVVGVIGPNGAGKTTLLKLAAGLLTPSGGSVSSLGMDPARAGRGAAAARIAFVPQGLRADLPLTASDLVSLGRTPHRTGFFDSARDRAAVSRALAFVDALHLASRPYNELSSGEQKRVLIARALAQEAELLLLDEPTANLDIAFGVDLFGRLAAFCEDSGRTLVASMHDLNIALLFCARLALMRDGRLVASGEPEAVMTWANVRAVFGCDVYVGRNELNGKLFMVPMSTGTSCPPRGQSS